MSDRTLSDALHRLMHAYRRQLRETIQSEGVELPITHIRVLKGVCRNAGSTAHSIATNMQRDKAQITRVLNELVSKGFVVRVSNPRDRRSQVLEPTAQGTALLDTLENLEKQVTAQMTHTLSEDEITTFVRVANLMTEQAGQTSANTRKT
ncbi:MarR family winged helix-turn-helix transcriptional regulator [Marinobacterium sp. YM272]|uniref:MarR family winged helix-turn-helix transcriptional regulator n=1 Tax=Marinobacterium sp. YM272 TaxID=3421654 RepID=UPI003D7FB283